MMSMIENLSPRERVLISVAGGLIALLLVSLLIIKPVLNFRADAHLAHEDAAATLSLVKRATVTPGAGEATLGVSELRQILDRTAQDRGVVIARFSTVNDAIDLSVTVNSVAALYSWLSILQGEHAIGVTEGEIRPASNGAGYSARLTLRQVV